MAPVLVLVLLAALAPVGHAGSGFLTLSSDASSSRSASPDDLLTFPFSITNHGGYTLTVHTEATLSGADWDLYWPGGPFQLKPFHGWSTSGPQLRVGGEDWRGTVTVRVWVEETGQELKHSWSVYVPVYTKIENQSTSMWGVSGTVKATFKDGTPVAGIPINIRTDFGCIDGFEEPLLEHLPCAKGMGFEASRSGVTDPWGRFWFQFYDHEYGATAPGEHEGRITAQRGSTFSRPWHYTVWSL